MQQKVLQWHRFVNDIFYVGGSSIVMLALILCAISDYLIVSRLLLYLNSTAKQKQYFRTYNAIYTSWLLSLNYVSNSAKLLFKMEVILHKKDIKWLPRNILFPKHVQDTTTHTGTPAY
jgi:hypothetical protein